eukprot:CAMPEP_0197235398 /NCGR_PEP_ID=MMETSP1429-20130617/2833_1 /TAXON_ID=49237 /ORGANISM="Chaetoceros  sp., Strain UNC1202" /LENGTH=509 /DNA_ID=CAMNT_0042693977 /DNA_START=52 /DNA_END=1581 /DNA_ORIENTATION=+
MVLSTHPPLTKSGPSQKYLLRVASSRTQEVEVIELGNEKVKYRLTGKNTVVSRGIPCIQKLQTKSEQVMLDMIYWCFTTNFAKFGFGSIFTFVVLQIVFAFLIVASLIRYPDCVNPSFDGISFERQMSDAFHLSWTTFTTVGYGIISPSTAGTDIFFDNPGQFHDDGQCLLISFLLSFESLVGVLFVGFCSAILFGKLIQFQSNAQVRFSSILPVKFGREQVSNYEDDVVSGSESSDDESDAGIIPFPVLKFRIVNLLHSNPRGAIIDGKLRVVASVDAKNSIMGVKGDAHKVFSNALKSAVTGSPRSKKGSGMILQKALTSISSASKQDASRCQEIEKRSIAPTGFTSDDMNVEGLRQIVNPDMKVQEEIQVEKPSMVFANIKVIPKIHPFFKRTWNITHTLDKNSPLLTRQARNDVINNGGGWPMHLNNSEGVEKSLQFDNLLVSFTGRSSISRTEVYCQHVYTMDDLRIGKEFKSVLMRNPADDSIFVHESGIDDLTEQHSGDNTS